MTRYLMWAAPLCLLATPVLAQEAAIADAAPAPTAKPKKVCRSTVTTGRRIAQRQCYTAEQWADYDLAQAEAAKKMVSDVTATGGKSNLSSGGNGSLSTGAVFGFGN